MGPSDDGGERFTESDNVAFSKMKEIHRIQPIFISDSDSDSDSCIREDTVSKFHTNPPLYSLPTT